MKFATYNSDTRELISVEEGSLDPLESKLRGRDVWLIPANSTEVLPPDVIPAGSVARWTGAKWEVLEDHRKNPMTGEEGTAFWVPSDSWDSPARYMTELGPLPADALFHAPDKPVEVKCKEDEENIRSERDRRMQSTLWFSDRHRSQKDAGLKTTLTDEQYHELGVYQQKLRDVPQQEGFPWDGDPNNPLIDWPTKPSFLPK